MTTLLLCNIGNRDVQIDAKYLSEPLRESKDQRERAAFLRANIESLHQHIDLAIIRKVIDYIGVEQINHLVLFGTNQQAEAYRQTDTVDMAYVVREVICHRWSITPDQVSVEILTVDPANQNFTMRFYEQVLPRLDNDLKPDQVYLEVTGGTPAMSNSLQLAGMEVFQDRATALYVSRESELPHRLAVGKRVIGGALRKVLQANLNAFHYHAALETWAMYRPYFTDSDTESAARVVDGLLRHAVQRINLDIPAARDPLRGLDGLNDGQYRDVIDWLYNSITPLDRKKALAEVLHIAQIRLETRNISEFLTQVVRFLENSLRFVCLNLGVPFVNFQNQPDENGAKVDKQWLNAQAIDKVSIGQAGLQKLLREFAPNDQHVQIVLSMAQRCEKLIHVRNESTHSLSGISETKLIDAFGQPINEILLLLDQTYHQLTGIKRVGNLKDNPYMRMNTFIEDLLTSRRA